MKLHNNQKGNTSISNLFLDHYMPQANGEFVKIYLYLMRCLSDPSGEISISGIADIFNQTEKDVMRALRYWEQEELLSLTINTEKKITDITLLDIESALSSKKAASESAMQEQAKEPSLTAVAQPPLLAAGIPSKENYDTVQLMSFLEEEEVSQILYIAQRYLGTTFSDAEINSILYFYDKLHFPSDLIEYLIEYCVTNGHRSMRYIEKVAMSWAEKKITSVVEAKAITASFNQNCFAVMKAFGLSGRNPASSEIALIQKWTRNYAFSLDIILEACNRTIRAIHQPSFEYADTILTRWYTLSVKTVEDILHLDEQFSKNNIKPTAEKQPKSVLQNRFNNMTPRSYVYDDLEKQLLNQ